METVITRIVQKARENGTLSAKTIDRLLRERCAELHDASRSISKRACMAYYVRIRDEQTAFWKSLAIDDATDHAIMHALRSKPRRTASGVATITVLTAPFPCSADCSYCPNDIRMPKSYLSDEPACQRAERNFFDPYLQMHARLNALHSLGHVVDKVETIVLGGTFSEYPESYRIWFVTQLFRALNEFGTDEDAREVERRRLRYRDAGLSGDPDENAERTRLLQEKLDAHVLSYNKAFACAYPEGLAFAMADEIAGTSFDRLRAAQDANAEAAQRMVGLVVETRPDRIDASHLASLRALGCTKIQLGIQSLNDGILAQNIRGARVEDTVRALELLRLFGFKSHVHFMINLKGSCPAKDLEGYGELVGKAPFKPDEVKLYPCALVKSARLMEEYSAGAWRPYSREELIDLLSACVLMTPPYTRISRMIRDISSSNIVAGNKSTNLRQMVEARIREEGEKPSEIRMREIAKRQMSVEELSLSEIAYRTSNTEEVFLQWTDDEGTLAAFLRLSFPDQEAIEQARRTMDGFPAELGCAMIREVHVYGRVSKLHESIEGTQHIGLGRMLIERACKLAHENGFTRIGVISAVGTRRYYERLGFERFGLYHFKDLETG